MKVKFTDSNFSEQSLAEVSRSFSSRKLSLQQEFLLTMMRLRLGLLTDDLAFRFQVSDGKISQTLITSDKAFI